MTSSEVASWVQAIGSLLAVFAAFLVPFLYGRYDRERARLARIADQDRSRLGHLQTVAADLRIADRQADVYLKSKIKLPAYRVPLHGPAGALPALIADGKLDAAQTTALVQWYVDARSFNDCLDIAQELKNAGRDWEREVSRIRIKASHLISGGKTSRFDEAIRALRKAGLPEASLERIPLNIRVAEVGEDDEDGVEPGAQPQR